VHTFRFPLSNSIHIASRSLSSPFLHIGMFSTWNPFGWLLRYRAGQREKVLDNTFFSTLSRDELERLVRSIEPTTLLLQLTSENCAFSSVIRLFVSRLDLGGHSGTVVRINDGPLGVGYASKFALLKSIMRNRNAAKINHVQLENAREVLQFARFFSPLLHAALHFRISYK